MHTTFGANKGILTEFHKLEQQPCLNISENHSNHRTEDPHVLGFVKCSFSRKLDKKLMKAMEDLLLRER